MAENELLEEVKRVSSVSAASLCSKALKLYTNNTNGEIIIWTHAHDSVEKASFIPDKWIAYKCSDWQVELSATLLNEMRDDRAKALPNETGGVLVGAYDIARRRIYIVYQVRDGISSPTSFIRGCTNLPDRFKYIYQITLDNLTYIGEWHSHPSGDTRKGMDDMKQSLTTIGKIVSRAV